MIARFLTAPLLWRRHVKAQERIATALEDLVAIQCRLHGFVNRPSDINDEKADGIELSYATDQSSFDDEQEEIHPRFTPR